VLLVADGSYREHLDSLPDGVRVEWFESEGELLDAVPEAEVLLLGPDRGWPIGPVVDAAKRLRWIHTRAAGVDRGQLQPLSLFRERDITVTNGSGISSVPIAEFVALAVLLAAKGMPQLLAQQRERTWKKPSTSRELSGTRAMLLGFGDVGRAAAARLQAFGVEVLAVRRHAAPEAGVEVLGPGEWRDRLGTVDWLVVTTPLTEDTRHLVGSAELAAMRGDAWLVNVSRGEVVDQGAVVAALRGGAIGGAVLDVTDPEPLPSDHELWGLPNAVVTPHCSWVSPAFPGRATDLFVDNLRRWCSGASLRNVVDLEAGY
jgi:phosphoglycerate dehydrogenase-like enzyme